MLFCNKFYSPITLPKQVIWPIHVMITFSLGKVKSKLINKKCMNKEEY